MTLPTVEELLKRWNIKYFSVAYSYSRTILKYTSVPVVAYGKGFGGMVFVIHTHRKFLAYMYGCKRPMADNGKEAGFAQMDVDVAIKTIREEPDFTQREINEDEVRVWESVKPDVVGSFMFEEKYSGNWGSRTYTERYRAIKENNKLKFQSMPTWSTYYHSCEPGSIVSKYYLATGKKKDATYTYQMIEEHNAKEIVSEAKELVILEKI